MGKLISVVLCVFPFVACADLPHPTYIHRLHRVGYEILPEDGLVNSMTTYVDASWTGWCIVAIMLVLGIALLIAVTRKWNCNVVRKLASASRIRMEHVVLTVLIVSAGYVAYRVFFKSIADQYKIALMAIGYTGTLYVDQPGWKYENKITETERAQLMAKLEAVKKDLQAEVSGSGIRIFKAEHWQEKASEKQSKINAVEKILLGNDSLRIRCRGIPIEYIAEGLVFQDAYHNGGSDHSPLAGGQLDGGNDQH